MSTETTKATIQHFTDAEYAVIVDSLAVTRDRVGGETPNIDSALAKFGRMGAPSGCAFITVVGEDMELILGAATSTEVVAESPAFETGERVVFAPQSSDAREGMIEGEQGTVGEDRDDYNGLPMFEVKWDRIREPMMMFADEIEKVVA